MEIYRRKLLILFSSAICGCSEQLSDSTSLGSVNPIDRQKHLPFDLDISNMLPGQMLSVPTTKSVLLVVKRTDAEIRALEEGHSHLLRDLHSADSKQPDFAENSYRSFRPDTFLVWGHCTRLGCAISRVSEIDLHSKKYKNLKISGYQCPCDGAAYDSAGRVFLNMPAKRNLEIPDYDFIDDTTIRVKG